MGNNHFYILLRLHQFLYDRLNTAKDLAFKKHRRSLAKNKTLPITPEGRYKRFKTMLFQMLVRPSLFSRAPPLSHLCPSGRRDGE